MKTIKKMYEHLNWSNLRILQTLQSAPNENQAVRRLFSHILLVEQVWINRIQGLDNAQPAIWSEMDMKACAELIQQNQENFSSLLNTLADAHLDNCISYTNSKGQQFTNSVRDILTHVALHGHYHRGQINQRLRIDGLEPVNTDFITFVR